MNTKQLMEWHFDVQKGMYFSRRTNLGSYFIYSSDIIEDGFWNYAFIPNDLDLSKESNNISSNFLSINRTPAIYIINGDSQQKKILSNADYTLLATESFMTYSNDKAIGIDLKDFIIKQAIDEKTQKDFEEVFIHAYGGEKTAEQPYGELDKTYITALKQSFSNLDKFYHFVCYSDLTPISIATLCFVDGKGGIYNVGTNLSYRGKGYGTATTKACIDKWKELNGDVLFLQTERNSSVEAWYYKLGFKLEFVGEIYYQEHKN